MFKEGDKVKFTRIPKELYGIPLEFYEKHLNEKGTVIYTTRQRQGSVVKFDSDPECIYIYQASALEPADLPDEDPL